MQTGDKHTKVGNIMFTQNDVQARKLQHATGTVLWKKTPGWQKMPPLQFSVTGYTNSNIVTLNTGLTKALWVKSRKFWYSLQF